MTRFDFEEKLVGCWNIVFDLNVIIEAYHLLSDEQRLNALIGLKQLYDIKFDNCFRSFEDIVANKDI